PLRSRRRAATHRAGRPSHRALPRHPGVPPSRLAAPSRLGLHGAVVPVEHWCSWYRPPLGCAPDNQQ
ncbi:hypothetical protein NYY90_20450, partial [Acinetobacter baumannii]|nr:hypothetical protein [Acinetobacter baumannii]